MIQIDEHIFQTGWFNHQLVSCFQIEIEMEIGPFEDVFPIENGDISYWTWG